MSQFLDDRAAAEMPRTYATLTATGISRHVLVGRKWRRVSRGIYVPVSTVSTTGQRIIEAAAAMGSRGVIAGWAAAFVHGADQFDGRDDMSLAQLPVPILMPVDVHRRSTSAFDYRQDELSVTDVTEIQGVRVTSPLRTALDLACWSRNRVESVVALDAMLGAGLVAPAELAEKLPSMAGHRGSRLAAEAIEQTRSSVRSTWESRLRMFCVWELGWHELHVNPTVGDVMGNLLGIPDLLDVNAGLALEYDGAVWKVAEAEAGHLDPEQHRRDNIREEHFERAGLTVVRIAKRDLTRHRPELRQRLVSARRQGLQRDRAKDRWQVLPSHEP